MPTNTLLEKFFIFHNTIDVTGYFLWDLYIDCLGTGESFIYVQIYNNQLIFSKPGSEPIVVYANNQWVNDAYKDIYISGGIDVEDGNAYNWFTMNADNYVPTYNITYNLQHVTATNYGGGAAPTTVSHNGSIALQLEPDTDFGLPSTIRISGDCIDTYLPQNKTLFIDNIKTDITITITGTIHRTYNIVPQVQNLTYIGDTTIETDGTATGTLYADYGYFLPQTINVVGCSYTYDKNTGIIEFSNPPYSSEGVYIYAQGTEIDTSDLTLILYRNNSERNRLRKYINIISTETGTLREKSSMLNPSILMEYDKVPDFNYVQIPNFKRYYYVDEIVSEGFNRWRIELSVDVLMSFSLSILELEAFVNRNEFDYNSLIVDNKLPKTSTENKIIISPVDNSRFNVDKQKARYIITGTNNVITQNFNSGLQKTFQSNAKMLISYAQLQLFFQHMNTNPFASGVGPLFAGRLFECLQSVRLYPFDFGDLWGINPDNYQYDDRPQYNESEIFLGNYAVPCNGVNVSHYADGYSTIIGGEFYITSNSWNDFSAEYEMYIPFVGFEKFEGYEIINKHIYIRYIIDFDTGTATVNIYSSSTPSLVDNNLIRTFTCIISVEIPISATDSSNTLNFIVNALSAFALGSMTKSLYSRENAAIGVVQSAINAAPHTIQKGRNSGAWGSIKTGLNPFIIKTIPDYYTPTNYAHLFGYPLNETRTLKNIHGYTEVGEVHLENILGAMIDETRQIGEALGNGVILP